MHQNHLAQLALLAHGLGELEQILLVGMRGEAVEHDHFSGKSAHDPEDLHFVLPFQDAASERVLGLEPDD